MTMDSFSSILTNCWQKTRKWILPVLVIGATILAGIGVAFLWGHPVKLFDDNYTVDNELLGTFGDFIGGFGNALIGLSTLTIALFTVYLQYYLTRQSNTLQSNLADESKRLQQDLMKQSKEETSLQRFHNLFFQLIETYHKQRDWLRQSTPASHSITPGQIPAPNYSVYTQTVVGTYTTPAKSVSFFDFYASELSEKVVKKNNYGNAVNDTKRIYTDFYLQHSNYLAPYFRILYRIYTLIDTYPIPYDTKMLYAKLMRGMISESELLFIRYNAMTSYGEKMRRLVNKYKITKHIPFFSLWEVNAILTSSKLSGPDIATLNPLLHIMGQTIFKYSTDRRQRPQEPILIDEDNKYKLEVNMSKPSETQVKLSINVNAQYKPHIQSFSNLRGFNGKSEEWLVKLFKAWLRELYAYGNYNAYQSYKQLGTQNTVDKSNPAQTVIIVSIKTKGKLPSLAPLRLDDDPLTGTPLSPDFS